MAMSAFWLTNLRKLIPTVAVQPKPTEGDIKTLSLETASDTMAREAKEVTAQAVIPIAVEKAVEITVPIVLTNAIKSFSKSFKFPYDEAKAAKIAVQLSRDNQREYITEADGRSKIVNKSDFAVSQYVKEMAKEKGTENVISSLPDAYKAPVRRMVGARAGEIDSMDSLEAAFVAAKGDFPSPDLLEGLNII